MTDEVEKPIQEFFERRINRIAPEDKEEKNDAIHEHFKKAIKRKEQ